MRITGFENLRFVGTCDKVCLIYFYTRGKILSRRKIRVGLKFVKSYPVVAIFIFVINARLSTVMERVYCGRIWKGAQDQHPCLVKKIL